MLVFNTKQEQKKNDVPGNILNEIIIDYGYIIIVFDISDQAKKRCLKMVLGRVPVNGLVHSLELREFQDFKTARCPKHPQTSNAPVQRNPVSHPNLAKASHISRVGVLAT